MLESFLNSTMSMATPIMLAALGELIVEESGIINVGIEGAMLAGAFFALAATYFSGSIALGLLCVFVTPLPSLAFNYALFRSLKIKRSLAEKKDSEPAEAPLALSVPA